MRKQASRRWVVQGIRAAQREGPHWPRDPSRGVQSSWHCADTPLAGHVVSQVLTVSRLPLAVSVFNRETLGCRKAGTFLEALWHAATSGNGPKGEPSRKSLGWEPRPQAPGARQVMRVAEWPVVAVEECKPGVMSASGIA